MRASRSLIPTVKEIPADAEVASHILMVRAGMIRKVAAGIYTVLPLGLRVMRKIERIVRQEMDAAGGQEVSMPVVIPAELWVRSGRWDYYGPELMRIKDRKGTDFCLGPTHEEVITQLAADEIRSYKQLPLNLYQIQTKFRDEIRPRFGLMRGREFIMKDAYSFDADHDAATASYWRMHEAYTRIFKRCGLGFRAVEADTGTIGGSLSHEFQVLADSGEDQIVACDSCDYAANTEKAALRPVAPSSAHDGPAIEAVATPAAHSIDAVSALLGIEPSRLIKALVFTADGEPVMALVRGDRALCEAKLRALLGADKLEAARRPLPALRGRLADLPPGRRGRPHLLPRHQVLASNGRQYLGRQRQAQTDGNGLLWDRYRAHRSGLHRTTPRPARDRLAGPGCAL
jgi:prolyl-tRNA synthetase